MATTSILTHTCTRTAAKTIVPGLYVKRKAYRAVQDTAGFLAPLVSRCCQAEHSPSSSGAIQRYAAGSAGGPRSLEDEGPLPRALFAAVKTDLTDAVISELRSATLGSTFAADRTHHIVPDLWTPPLVDHFATEMAAQWSVDRAHKRLDRKYKPPVSESGRHLLEVMCSSATTPASETLRQRWHKVIDQYTLFLSDRSRLHELENLPQEIAMGEVLARCVGCVRLADPEFSVECVVDVGGGNGFLAAQLGERLGCDAVVVDPHFPAHAIDCAQRPWVDTADRRRPRVARRQALHRRVAYFRDTVWERDVPAPPQRTALVAKHLCGTAIDECLRHLEGQGCLPRVLVLAPCCLSKMVYSSYCNPDYLAELLGVHGPASLDRLSRLTDWNMTLLQHQDERRVFCGCETMERQWATDGATTAAASSDLRTFSTVRGGRDGSVAASIPAMHSIAQLAETVINRGRLLWLEQHGYKAELVQYVPYCVTPKNKCIVAYREDKPPGCLSKL